MHVYKHKNGKIKAHISMEFFRRSSLEFLVFQTLSLSCAFESSFAKLDFLFCLHATDTRNCNDFIFRNIITQTTNFTIWFGCIPRQKLALPTEFFKRISFGCKPTAEIVRLEIFRILCQIMMNFMKFTNRTVLFIPCISS